MTTDIERLAKANQELKEALLRELLQIVDKLDSKHTVTLCGFESCSRLSRTRGYCKSHYQQVLRGKPLTPLRTHNPSRG